MLPGYRLIDLDEYIEGKAGRKIPDIFEKEGEQAFRDMEKKAVDEVLAESFPDSGIILSLGGGTLTDPVVAGKIAKETENFYLRAGIDTLVGNLEGASEGRPMLKGDNLRSRIEKLMDQRSGVYERTAAHIIDTDGRDCADVAAEIASLLTKVR